MTALTAALAFLFAYVVFAQPVEARRLHARRPEFAMSGPEFVIALYEDDGTLTLGIRPDGNIKAGPNYQPDEAAAEFWDAVTRAAQAAAPWGQT